MFWYETKEVRPNVQTVIIIGRVKSSISSTPERRHSKIGPVKPLYWPDHQTSLLGTSECLIFHVQEFLVKSNQHLCKKDNHIRSIRIQCQCHDPKQQSTPTFSLWPTDSEVTFLFVPDPRNKLTILRS